MRRRQPQQRGATLIEILISMALVMVGLLGLFATLSSVTFGSSTSNRLAQAQLRAQSILESIRMAPDVTLSCLAAAGSNWASCETNCLASQVGDAGGTLAPSAQACIFTTTSMNLIIQPPSGAAATANQSIDRTGQPYVLLFDGSNGARDSFVLRTGPNARVYDIQVTVGWNDNGTLAVTAGQPGVHSVTLRTGVFR